MTHTHKCGLTALGMLEGYGCGHVWSHDPAVPMQPADHMCPNCGRGPFYAKV